MHALWMLGSVAILLLGGWLFYLLPWDQHGHLASNAPNVIAAVFATLVSVAGFISGFASIAHEFENETRR